MGLQFLFMDDNAPCHRTVAAEQLLESEDIERMDWLARSPDLNPSSIFPDVIAVCLQIFTLLTIVSTAESGRGSLVVKESDHGWHVTCSRPVPIKTHCVGKCCTLSLSRAQTSSHWWGLVVWRGDAGSGVVIVT
ncbi:hypothetical protein TNCV_2675911 [Trichonephila clavipes]|nr:hypothetical protein TNCV_2675911 [Trichonephila clavipes]